MLEKLHLSLKEEADIFGSLSLHVNSVLGEVPCLISKLTWMMKVLVWS